MPLFQKERAVFLLVHREKLRLWLVFYAGNKAHGGKHGHHGRSPITEERQRDADDRGDADAHAYINQGLDRDSRGDAHAYKHIEGPAGVEPHTDTVDDYYDQQQDHHQTADHTQGLSDGRKDKVRVFAGKNCCGMLGVHPGHAAGGKAHLALGRLPGDAVACGIHRGVIGGHKTLLLIILEKIIPQQRYRSGHSGKARRKPVQLYSRRKQH